MATKHELLMALREELDTTFYDHDYVDLLIKRYVTLYGEHPPLIAEILGPKPGWADPVSRYHH